MFDAIAPRYDLLNRVLSLGIDRLWRRRTVEWLREDKPGRILDVATGTADLAIESLSLDPDSVVGVDLSEEMLRVGREKLERLNLSERITLRQGDSERLPFSDAQFDAAMVAFGVRNFENLERGLREIRRVLKKDGVLVVLEFSHPTAFPVKQVYGIYSKYVLPRIGGALSRDDGAYRYLPDSVAQFPDGGAFLDVLRRCGFNNLDERRLTFGIASIYKGYANG